MGADTLEERLERLARVRLACLPTPLCDAPRLSEELGVPIWLKRDDLTGIGLGGTKVRALELILGDGLARGCDVLVTGSGPHSNWSMLAALSARRCEMASVLCFYGNRPSDETGNLRLVQGFTGATVRFSGDLARTSVDALIEEVAAELEGRSHRPLVLPRGGAVALGSVGFYLGAREIREQADRVGLQAPGVWLATGSCGTQAGVVLATATGELDRVVGVSVSRPVAECAKRVHDLATAASGLLQLPAPDLGSVDVRDGWIGPGYGISSDEGQAAAALVARTEGVLLDPCFGAKAMAALVESVRTGQEKGPVVFLVSGGAPTLFAKDIAL
ncbi:pyridoxal-phosphate dependent enzyme [Nocardioides marmoriginsengisoli]|uniref:Pyridoxal-phosphate dependent enzyme n=1 Tax=Nocardioides marmoriginsengisoli TaxID=661483 RepID=A0A3N0CHA5_9ACTN|nr:pyridoxal-phosphate dependent enzyme [Nocardioides marmoriginsengisoli]RNL62832.1 pyridoxal-phosphate dependent enzyme [Nocardioides marmoriginsengisoli]